MATLLTTNHQGAVNFRYSLAALEHIRSKLASKQCAALCIRVTKRGCSGLTYDFDYSDAAKEDEIAYAMENGVLAFVARNCEGLLNGAVLEYVKSGFSGRLTFINPNEIARCGCGESFTIAGQ